MGDALGNGEACEVSHVERVITDVRGGIGKSYACKLLTVIECVRTDNYCILVLGVKAYGCKVFYAAERFVTDLGYVLTYDCLLDLGVVLKYGCTDLGDAVPRKLGKVTVKVLRVEEDLAKTLGVKCATEGLEGLAILVNDYLGKRGAACKYGICKRGNRCGNVNGCEIATSRECGRTERDGSGAVCKVKCSKTGTVLECVVADLCGGCMGIKLGDALTAVECARTDLGKDSGGVNAEGGKCCVALERV